MRALPVAALLIAACGGIAVIDGDGGGGGGGSSTRTTSTTGPMSSVSTGPSYECEQACGALYDCALGSDPEGKALCPGLTGDATQRKDFVGYCVDTSVALGCAEVLQYVKPGDCYATVTYFKSYDTEFSFMCKYGVDG